MIFNYFSLKEQAKGTHYQNIMVVYHTCNHVLCGPEVKSSFAY